MRLTILLPSSLQLDYKLVVQLFVVRQLPLCHSIFSLHVVTKPTSASSQAAYTSVRQACLYMVCGVLSDLRPVTKGAGQCDAGMGVLQGMHGSTYAPLSVSLGPLQLQWRRWWKEQMQQATQWCTALASLQRLSI